MPEIHMEIPPTNYKRKIRTKMLTIQLYYSTLLVIEHLTHTRIACPEHLMKKDNMVTQPGTKQCHWNANGTAFNSNSTKAHLYAGYLIWTTLHSYAQYQKQTYYE